MRHENLRQPEPACKKPRRCYCRLWIVSCQLSRSRRAVESTGAHTHGNNGLWNYDICDQSHTSRIGSSTCISPVASRSPISAPNGVSPTWRWMRVEVRRPNDLCSRYDAWRGVERRRLQSIEGLSRTRAYPCSKIYGVCPFTANDPFSCLVFPPVPSMSFAAQLSLQYDTFRFPHFPPIQAAILCHAPFKSLHGVSFLPPPPYLYIHLYQTDSTACFDVYVDVEIRQAQAKPLSLLLTYTF